MAYTTANLNRIGTANSDAGSLWIYKSSDALATVIADDYFSDGDVRGMRADDVVIVVDDSLNRSVQCIVTAVTTNGAATIAAQAADNAAVLAEAKTLVAADSGTTYFLNLADGFTVTLPAPELGLRFKFIVSTAPTTAYVITTNGGDDIMIGGINELEVDTGDDGPYDNNADTLNFVASVAVVGDFVEMVSDGTSWFFNGQTNADGGITTSTT